ncbi:hypothetical protein LIER_28658 [Lithospermum erythrorhizon]|uniref:Uncharacterized protein n=1 Tax=Lithospermum erythrorhizon TaxID=34254 RepID=A0AAV3RI10_LITER
MPSCFGDLFNLRISENVATLDDWEGGKRPRMGDVVQIKEEGVIEEVAETSKKERKGCSEEDEKIKDETFELK